MSTPVLLTAEELQKTFGGVVVLDRTELTVRQGEVILLKGGNGCGKTTLLNILSGNLEPDSGVIRYTIGRRGRQFRFPRPWRESLNPRLRFRSEFVARLGLGRTWQESRLFASLCLRDNIAVAARGQPGENPLRVLLTPRRTAAGESRAKAAAVAALGRLGLAGREESTAERISMGQAKRVAIARAAAVGSTLLLLDEPLAGLDRAGMNDTCALLGELVRDRNLTLVVVEHELNQPRLADLVTTTWELAGGKVTARPGFEAARPASGAAGPWVGLFAGADDAVTEEPLPRGATLTRVRRAATAGADRKAVLEVRDLTLSRGRRPLLGFDDDGRETGLGFTLYEGELAVLQAPNGWGKSTFLAAVMGELEAARGDVRLLGRSLGGLPPWGRARLGIRPLMSAAHGFPGLTAAEFLRLAGAEGTIPWPADRLRRRVGNLSGGEKQRLGLAAAVGGERPTTVVLLDEPFTGLDGPTIRAVARELRALADRVPVLILQPKASGGAT